MMTQQAAKLRSFSARKLTTGLRWRNSQKISATKPTTNATASVWTRQMVAQPVPLLALAKNDFPPDHDHGQKRQANCVKVERLLAQLGAPGDEIIRVAKHDVTGAERCDADRHVDQKAPAPIVSVCEPTAQGRTDDGRYQHGKAEKRHCHALPFPREGVQQYALTAGLQTAARKTLNDAEQDQLAQTAGQSAHEGTEGEYCDRRICTVVSCTRAFISSFFGIKVVNLPITYNRNQG